ncbi:MAG: methionyl-tRNA formyltransferase [Acidimicrobiales bacterium]
MSNPLAVPPSDIKRVVFLGTPEPSVVALRALLDAGFDIPLVVSRPDRRRGRGSKLIPSPVKQAALDLGLSVSDDMAEVAEVANGGIDAAVVVAYGRIIPVALLEQVPMVNIHFSLLPRWRGAAPVERAILAGDSETGVCLMEVAEGLDEGGVYARATTPIGENESAEDLRDRLAVLGADLLVENLSRGLGEPEPQVGEITYAAKIDRGESRLRFDRSAIELQRTVRVGRAWAEFRGKRLGIESATVEPGTGKPGELQGLSVATADGLLGLVTVKPEGKRAMPAQDWANGLQLKPGESLV